MSRKMSSVGFLLGVVLSCVSAYPAIHHHGHMHKRQSYARSNQLPSAQEPYGQSSYNNYNYYGPRSQSSGYYNGNGFGQPGHYQQYDYSPQYNHAYGRGDPIQGSYAHANPVQRELNVRNGQLRQKEYQQRTGQEGRDTYDPFYFYVNPVAAVAASGASLPASASPGPVLVSAPTSVTAVSSREHVGGPPRNRRNSLNARDSYFDNEISGDKYEILNKPSHPRGGPPTNYPYPTSRYSSGVNQGHYQGAPGTGNSNQFLNYDQIVGAQPPRYASGSPSRGQPWSVQIGTQLKVNDDGKGPNSGSRYYVRDERNTRPRQPPPPYRK